MTTPDNDQVVQGAYCKVSDLVLGDVQIGGTVNVASYIQRAANEMNLKMSSRFKVPMSPQVNPENLITINFLRDVNASLASGRLIMSLSVNRELERVNAYANRLIRDALDAIAQVMSGDLALPGLIAAAGSAKDSQENVLIGNQDAASGVDAFYKMVMPGGPGTVHRPWW